MKNILSKHLGGHANITHVDEGILDHCINKLEITSFLDIGCGIGGMVDLAHERGLTAIGIDGDSTVERKNDKLILIHDFVLGKINLEQTFDLGWSVEFVEHVEEQFVPNFMSAFSSCKTVLMTHAPPGKGGHHHVNCQSTEYWIEIFREYGFIPDFDTLNVFKKCSTMRREFVRKNGIYFINQEYL